MKTLLILTSFFILACAPDREQSKERAFIPSIKVANEKISAKVQSPLKNSNLSASARVSALAQDTTAKTHFRFLHAFESRNEKLVGRVEVSANPFIQFALSSERLKRDDLKKFIAQVEQAHKNGEISGVQWAAFVVARQVYETTGSTWGLIKFQTKAINQKVAATFPGVLGGVGELEKSLPYLLIRKFDGGIDPSNTEAQKTLAASLPLLTPDFHNDMRDSLSAAINNYPLNQNLSDSERVSSFVLFQRLFAQLLVLKGYNSAKYKVVEGKSAVSLLTDDQKSFETAARVGYFMDPKTGKNVALTSEDIASYDPSQRPLLLTSKPGGALATLDLELKVMGATALAFEASSPAAYFVNDPSQYIFGDVTSLINRAIVPAEAHALSFGLTVMQLKNISARNLAVINESGKDIAVAGGEPAGIVLFDQVGEQRKVQLNQILKLIEFNLQMDAALEQVIQKSEKNHAQLKAMNSLYEAEGMIANMAMLREKLKSMRLPLYLLTMRMIRNDREVLNWNPTTGFVRLKGESITSERKQQVGAILRDLGIHMDQPLILEVGNRLLSGQNL